VNGSKEKFSIYYKVAAEVIESVSGASANRHGTNTVLSSEHASLVSTRALHQKIVDTLRASNLSDERDAPVPSPQMLAISLSPQYASRETAKHFSCRFQLRRGIQQATMRKDNIDANYNHRLNQTGNNLVLEVNKLVYSLYRGFPEPCGNGLILSKGAIKISVDDKAAVPIGEPGYPVRTGVRKISASLKPEIAAAALDHDFHRANIRPSLSLFISTPTKISDSWRRGSVISCLKEGATQYSTAMRHAVELGAQILAQVELDDAKIGNKFPFGVTTSLPFGFYIRSDGGGDGNPKHASVQMSLLYLFLTLDADFLIAMVTAPEVSAVNEVEGIMPVANLAFQNQAFARQDMTVEMEHQFKGANSGKAIRKRIAALETQSEQENALAAWRNSVEPVRRSLSERLTYSTYCDKPISIFDPATEESILDAFSLLKTKVDESIDPDTTTWTAVHKNNAQLTAYLDSHVQVERYHVEFKKCGKTECTVCTQVRMPIKIWSEIAQRPRLVPLPTPVAEEVGQPLKYDTYENLKNIPTRPNHRPSFAPPATPTDQSKKHDKKISADTRIALVGSASEGGLPRTLWHNNNIRSCVVCANCTRPRLIFHWRIFESESWIEKYGDLDGVLSESAYEYICGDELFGIPEDPVPHPKCTDGFHVRTALTCGMLMEKQYFTSTKGIYGSVRTVWLF
jgi:hypothetical protein